MLFCQTFSLEQMIKLVTRIQVFHTNHILRNSRENISQSGDIDIGISDYQLIYLTRKLHWMKSNTYK